MIGLSPTPDELDAAIRTLVGEASNQGAIGLAAVAWTFVNRALWDEKDHPGHAEWWGATLGAVCRKPEQYSCWNGGNVTDRIVAMKATDREYLIAQAVLKHVLAGETPDPTGGSTTYKVRGTKASWDEAVAQVAPRSIGAHDFWRLSFDGKCLSFTDQQQGALANV